MPSLLFKSVSNRSMSGGLSQKGKWTGGGEYNFYGLVKCIQC